MSKIELNGINQINPQEKQLPISTPEKREIKEKNNQSNQSRNQLSISTKIIIGILIVAVIVAIIVIIVVVAIKKDGKKKIKIPQTIIISQMKYVKIIYVID